MTETNFPKQIEKFEIQSYKKPKDVKILKETHVPYSGSPQKHPYDPEKIILLVDPYSSTTFYYEFRTDDISYVEELPSIVNMEGETVTMMRLWVKKMSLAIRCTPFWVESTIKRAR